jgi:5-methylcytosine-specific restriction endonuclease McrA
MNTPWLTPEGLKIWKTESQYWQWLRGSLRRLWGDYPLRKQWKANQLRLITPEEKASKLFHPSTKNLGQCFYCGQWFAGSKLECDHKTPSDGCISKETAESFLWYCGGGIGDEWVLSCKPCHKVKTHSERQGLTMEEASIEKLAIDLIKKKIDKEYILSKNAIPASNQKARRVQIIEILKEEMK